MKAAAIAAALAVALTAAPAPARADVGIGLFVGEPLGLTLKVGLQRKTALEVLVGVDDWDEDRGRDGYGHLTFLVQAFAARGESVIIPFRLGIGGAIYDDGGDDDVNLAARAPFQLAFVFTNTPLELYLELALRLEIIDDDDGDDRVDLDGGLGFRIYF